jgi:TadE-like protein
MSLPRSQWVRAGRSGAHPARVGGGRAGAGRVGIRRYGDRGSATAELAVGLPALVLLLLFALGAVQAVTAQLRCVDAARDAALAQSRGGDGLAAGRDRAPSGATVSVTTSGGQVRAEVRVMVRPLGPHLPSVEVGATAVAEVEPTTADLAPGGTPGPAAASAGGPVADSGPGRGAGVGR